ncbi:MAG TPA: hypothetical protein VMT52_00625, partial [Planctomycetota bacterium]|nr:hypothetical protein [Planctomycetota bacterium]
MGGVRVARVGFVGGSGLLALAACALGFLNVRCASGPGPAAPPGAPPDTAAGTAPAAAAAAEAPPPWDAAAFALFEKRGLAPPRTVSTLESGGVIDLNWIREAIAEAKVVPREVDEPRAAAESPSAAISLAAEESADGTPMEDSTEAAVETPVSFEPFFKFPDKKDWPGTQTFHGTSATAGAGGREAGRVERALTLQPAAGSADAGESNVVSAIETPRKLDTRLLTPPRLGKILVMNAEGRFESLVPRALRLQVFVEGPRARTVVDYVFSNPHDRRLEGTFYYPLPADASPAAFGMFPGTAKIEPSAFGGKSLLPPLFEAAPGAGDGAGLLASLAPSKPPIDSPILTEAALVKDWGELQIASVVPATRAREVYEQVVRRDIDPALLEWSGGNTFAARVFPIEPHSVKRVVL